MLGQNNQENQQRFDTLVYSIYLIKEKLRNEVDSVNNTFRLFENILSQMKPLLSENFFEKNSFQSLSNTIFSKNP